MKISLSFILYFLIFFLSSCSINQSIDKNDYELNINLQTSNKNRELIIETLLKENIKFSVNFNLKESPVLDDSLINSNLQYFCKSFIESQYEVIETSIFNLKGKKVLTIYSDDFKNKVNTLKIKYPNNLYVNLSKNDYKSEIEDILEVSNSYKRYSFVNNLDKNVNINHSPRVRDDIDSIFFLVNYESAKAIIPIFNSYTSSIKFYSTSEVFHDADEVKKLIDFENTFIPLPKDLVLKMSSIESGNIKQSIERLMILDFLTIEEIYQRNLFSEEVNLNTGFKKVKKNQCIDRDLPLWKISNDVITNQI